MPRKAKEEIDEVTKKDIKEKSKSTKVASTKASTKKAVSKKETKKVVDKKTPSKKATKNDAKKENTNKKSVNATKKKTESVKKSVVKKSTTKSSTKVITKAKKDTTKAKTSKKTSTQTKPTKKKVEIIEYYDLPYRYNETIVKVLAQTPTTLFVYWDISDNDRKKYIEQYGEYFFHNTKPVLIIHNKTKNYNYEVDINDFANSWYLNLIDSNCDYQIELGRRPINNYVNIADNYLYITTSNEIESPNDRILFDRLSHFVYFKNVKTNEIIKKNINLTLLNKIGKFASISEFYKNLYPEEAIDFDRLDLRNPSSNNPTSSFK